MERGPEVPPAATEGPAETPPAQEAAAGNTAEAPDQRVADLEAALAAAQAEKAEYYDKWLRALAELDNYKKRMERWVADLARSGKRDLLLRVLPVLDNLQRAAAYDDSSVDAKSLLQGVRMTIWQFQETLKNEGVREVETVGKPFDPQYHEAVGIEETEAHEAGTVVAEVLKGYTYGDELLRPARVKVAAQKSG